MALKKVILALLVLGTGGVVVRRKGNSTGNHIPASKDFFLLDIPGLGKVQGREAVEGPIGVFLGVPYAEQPVGKLRWRSPQRKQPWKGVIDATELGPVCPQFPTLVNLTKSLGTSYEVSESCLFVNIYSPMAALSPGAPKMPVMVFVTGDGFVGDTPDSTRGGLTVTGTNNTMVMVEISFRLNVFGFLASPELLDRNRGGGLNFGLQDQQEALRFVQRHISIFGGNPEQVMLFGVSSGGSSVMMHMVMPDSAGLFTSAAMMSGFYAEMVADYDLATANYHALLKKLKCEDLDCLEKLPVHELIRMSTSPSSWQATLPQVLQWSTRQSSTKSLCRVFHGN